MTVEAPVAVVCRECGARFELSARNARAWRRRGQAPVCGECRHPVRPVDEKTRRRMVRWWLYESGLTRAELQELARSVFG